MEVSTNILIMLGPPAAPVPPRNAVRAAGVLLMRPSLGQTGLFARPAISEAKIIEDIAARIRATGLFADVMIEHPSDRRPSLGWPVAIVSDAGGSDETPRSGTYEADEVEVTGRFAVAIVVGEATDAAGYPPIKTYENAVRRAINGKSLAGATLPALTRIARRRAGSPGAVPDRTWMMDGQYVYLADGDSAFDDVIE